MPRVRRTVQPVAGIATALLLAAFFSSHTVRAQQTGDPYAGHQLATTWCSNCHVVDPQQQRATSNGAPTFAAIAAGKTTTELGLHAFLQTPHGRMPDLHLSREEIDNLAVYIISLRPPSHS